MIWNITTALGKGDNFANFSIDVENMKSMAFQYLLSHHWYPDIIGAVAVEKNIVIGETPPLISNNHHDVCAGQNRPEGSAEEVVPGTMR
jgi:hypothetical protein